MTFSRSRLIPWSLVALSLVPVAGGVFRVTQLAGDAPVTEDNARFFDAPIPVVLHIIGAIVYLLVGAFQFDPKLRRSRPRWHRMAGRVIVPCGLIVAGSAIWMTLFYDVPSTDDGAVLVAIRLFFGAFMAAAIGLAVVAIRRRDIATHRAWMMRAYAVGIAAGTQAFTHIPFLVVGEPDEVGRTVAMAAGWFINLAVAEWLIRRKPGSRGAGVVRQEGLRRAGSMG